MTDQTTAPEPREPDNPAAWALAQHIADHPMSTVQAAFRYLNAPLTVELHEQPASAVPLPPADQTPLRDCIAEAALAVVEAALGDTLVPAARAEALAGITAVLPATTRHDTDTSGFELRGDTEIRAAALREAIALLDQRASSIDAFSSSDFGEEARAVRELTDVANELRRVADETAATESTADKAARLGMTPEEYRAHCHLAAVRQIRAALPGLYATTGLRVEAALTETAAETPAVPVQHAPGKVICCADCRTKGHTVCQDETAAEVWRGATEVISDREVERLAATGLVGYRQGLGRLLYCLHHKPVPASRWADFHEVTSDDLPDGGICVHPRCGADLLAVQPAAGARQDGAQR
ncbi:hypothetical protein ACFXAS_05495 [Streptomyces sp. NPDC059459]|uniref:hypothetical protein n=1 Tax=Streptomyces sp. NPDC059459 TaxID=3346839 RepID=UPI0036D0CE10